MSKQLVVLLLELDSVLLKECGLTEKQFEELPMSLAREVKKLAPKALSPKAVYFLSDKAKSRVEKVLDAHAIDFSEVILNYADKRTPACTVILLDSYRPRKH